MSDVPASSWTARVSRLTRKIDRPIVIAFACIVALLLVGGMFSRNFTSPEYILLQLKVGAFLGIIATGLMMVILLGHIDLSLPWTITVGAMMACAVAGHGEVGRILAIPVGIGCGVLIGIVNGILVALLRIPSMIATLATNAVAQGIMIVYTGGSSPQDSAPQVMRWLAAGWLIAGVPNAVALWLLIGAATMFLLSRTTFGRSLYAIGNTERAAYLSGIDTRLVTVAAFAVCGAVDGRCVPVAGDRRGRARRHVDSGRSGFVPRHRGWRDPHHAAAVDPFSRADAGGGASDHLRRGDRGDVAAVWAQQAGGVGFESSRTGSLRPPRACGPKIGPKSDMQSAGRRIG
jgi:ribose transport system permease protein